MCARFIFSRSLVLKRDSEVLHRLLKPILGSQADISQIVPFRISFMQTAVIIPFQIIGDDKRHNY